MSSDTFHIRIAGIEGDTIELLCTTGTAGGYNDYACTRSFVLMVLEDAIPYGAKTPLRARLAELAGGGHPPVWERSFHEKHVGEFLASVELVNRVGIIANTQAWAEGRFASSDAVADRDYPLHRFLLRARVTDPKWLEGIEVGASFGTTAFDAWWDDPTRQRNSALAAIERKATRWYPNMTKLAAAKKAAKAAAKKSSTKKAAKKSTAKKAATKKTAAKKTTAKKTATKKTAAKKTAAKKTTAKKAPKKTAKKTTAKKAPKKTAKKTAAKKAPKKKAPKKRPA